jgi:hypothetical protein
MSKVTSRMAQRVAPLSRRNSVAFGANGHGAGLQVHGPASRPVFASVPSTSDRGERRCWLATIVQPDIQDACTVG